MHQQVTVFQNPNTVILGRQAHPVNKDPADVVDVQAPLARLGRLGEGVLEDLQERAPASM